MKYGNAATAIKELGNFAGSANGNAESAKYLIDRLSNKKPGDIDDVKIADLIELVEWALEQSTDAKYWAKNALDELRKIDPG